LAGLTPEQSARKQIDAVLSEAGWIVQNRDEANLQAGQGVAIREFKMASGHGFADYLLFVDGHAVGTLEAKKEGFTLRDVEVQARKYAEGLPAALDAPIRPLPFLYVSTGVETRFTNGLDPRPRSRRVFGFHRPKTFAEWLAADTLAQWAVGREQAGQIQTMPPVHIPHLWLNKVKAITHLEQSLRDDRPRALIQMATSSARGNEARPTAKGGWSRWQIGGVRQQTSVPFCVPSPGTRAQPRGSAK